MKLTIKISGLEDIHADLEQRKKRTIEVIYNEILKLVSARPISREDCAFLDIHMLADMDSSTLNLLYT